MRVETLVRLLAIFMLASASGVPETQAVKTTPVAAVTKIDGVSKTPGVSLTKTIVGGFSTAPFIQTTTVPVTTMPKLNIPIIKKQSIILYVNDKCVSFKETTWRKALASVYGGYNDHQGPWTAWCNGVNSRGFWDPIINRWIKSSRKLIHFKWMGHTDWHRFNTYRYKVPTVAHKTHEFGTFIRFKYRNQVQIAIVTDRGPYVGKREWDLNPCLSKALGFDGVGEVEYNILTQVN